MYESSLSMESVWEQSLDGIASPAPPPSHQAPQRLAQALRSQASQRQAPASQWLAQVRLGLSAKRLAQSPRGWLTCLISQKARPPRGLYMPISG